MFSIVLTVVLLVAAIAFVLVVREERE